MSDLLPIDGDSDYDEENTRASVLSRMAPALWLIGGVALGLLIMRAISAEARDPSAHQASLPKAQSLYEAPEVEAPAQPVAPPTSEEETKDDAAAPPSQTPAQTPGAPATPPPTIGGALAPGAIGGGVAPVNPIVIEGDRPAEPEAGYVEFAAIVSEMDAEPLLQRVRSLAKARGAQVQFEFVRDPDRPELGTDLVISTPKAEASKLAEEILKLEATQEMDRWNGPASERHHRTGRFLRDNIDQLESRLRQLTIKYLDDAPEVVRTREALERSRKALDSLRPIPVDREAIRVFVGKYSPGAGRSS